MTDDLRLIHTQGLDEGIRCAMCTNTMKSDKGCDGGCVVDQKMYEKVLKVIDEALESQRWIPCSEKLPEYTTDYLVMVGINYDGMGMTNEIRTALYHTVGKTWMVYEDKKNTLIGEVIAWQLLPDPYKAESEDVE